jgi:hypothetical protein
MLNVIDGLDVIKWFDGQLGSCFKTGYAPVDFSSLVPPMIEGFDALSDETFVTLVLYEKGPTMIGLLATGRTDANFEVVDRLISVLVGPGPHREVHETWSG